VEPGRAEAILTLRSLKKAMTMISGLLEVPCPPGTRRLIRPQAEIQAHCTMRRVA